MARRQGRPAEAERLAREAYPRKKKGRTYFLYTLLHLVGVLQEQGKDREVAALCSQELPGLRAAASADHSRSTHGEFTQVLAAFARSLNALGSVAETDALYDEQLQWLRQSKDPRLAGDLATRTASLLSEGRCEEAEPLARECLAIREKALPDNWLTFNTQSLLGDCLLGQKKFAEAEPLLLSGCEGMKLRRDKISAGGTRRLKEAIQRLLKFYEATGQPDHADQWRTELAEWYRGEAARLRRAVESVDVQAFNNLGWFLATCDDPAIRDGKSAVQYAEKAVAATGRKNASFLDTLAAARAETGDFTGAIAAQNDAIALLHDEVSKRAFTVRLKLYESKIPCREP